MDIMFEYVLNSQEGQSLKDIFDFTCKSYVISEIPQEHGRIGDCRILADSD